MIRLVLALVLFYAAVSPVHAADSLVVRQWKSEFPLTDFLRSTINLEDLFDVVHRDAVPAITKPKLVPLAELSRVQEQEPVVSVSIGKDSRAYPLRVLIWHEVVNDEVGGVPIAVTYSPLTNSTVVFDRRIDGHVHEFGITGRVRNADTILYDKQTETWWQQFTGEGIVGAQSGKYLAMLPARLESLARFRERASDGWVLIPRHAMRPYGQNPYPHYDSRERPDRTFQGVAPAEIAPMARVVQVGNEAWSLDLLRLKKRITSGDLTLVWEPGQVSALDAVMISTAKDVGNVTVRRGEKDEIYTVSFAFAFRAFHPNGRINVK